MNPAVGCHYFPPGLQLPPQPLRRLLPILLLGKQRHDGCEQFAWDCYPTASRLRFESGPFCESSTLTTRSPSHRSGCGSMNKSNKNKQKHCPHNEILYLVICHDRRPDPVHHWSVHAGCWHYVDGHFAYCRSSFCSRRSRPRKIFKHTTSLKSSTGIVNRTCWGYNTRRGWLLTFLATFLPQVIKICSSMSKLQIIKPKKWQTCWRRSISCYLL